MALNEKPLTAVVAAMEEELVALRARLTGQRAVAVTAASVTAGWLGESPVALVVTGDGERNARRGLAALLAALPVRRVIVAGVAGGLSPGLKAGALVLGERVVCESDGSVLVADGALIDVAASACGAQRGVVVTATRIADTAQDKRRIFALATAQGVGRAHAAGAPVADDLAAVVDLESAPFAAAAARAGIPWVVVRAVSDTAGEGLPLLLNQSRDDGGAVRRGRVVRALLTNPKALLPLLALRERVRACAGALAGAIELTVAALAARDLPGPVVTGPAPDFANAIVAREV